MTDNIWSDIAIWVLCSVVGGSIVATLFEFIPNWSSRVRRAVLITYWLIFLSVAPLVVVYLIWERNVLIVGVAVVVIFGIIFRPVVREAKEAEKKEK